MEPIKPINFREASDRNVTENLHLNPNLREGINRVSGNEKDTVDFHITGPDGSEISSENLRVYVEQSEINIEVLGVGGEVSVKPIKPVNRGGGPPPPHFSLNFSLDSETKLVFKIPVKEAMQ